MAKTTKAQKKVGKVMREFKEGTLHSGKKGPVVKSRKQAIAIAMSEAGMKKPVKKAMGGMVKSRPVPKNSPAMGPKTGISGAMGIKKYAAGGPVTPGKPQSPLAPAPRGFGPNDGGPRPRPMGATSGVKKGATKLPTTVQSAHPTVPVRFKKGGMAKKGCK